MDWQTRVPWISIWFMQSILHCTASFSNKPALSSHIFHEDYWSTLCFDWPHITTPPNLERTKALLATPAERRSQNKIDKNIHVNNLLGMIKYTIGYTCNMYTLQTCASCTMETTRQNPPCTFHCWMIVIKDWLLLRPASFHGVSEDKHLIQSAGVLSCLCDLVFSVPSAGPPVQPWTYVQNNGFQHVFILIQAQNFDSWRARSDASTVSKEMESKPEDLRTVSLGPVQ